MRFQALVLVGVYLVALGLKLVFDLRAPDGPRGLRQARRELVRFWPTAAAGLVVGGVYVAYKAAQGAGLETGLGAYGGVLQVEYDLRTRSTGSSTTSPRLRSRSA